MNWLRRVMMGRYGIDPLGYAMLVCSILLMLLDRISGWRVFGIVEFALLTLCYLRMFSRNISRRYQENQRFMKIWRPVYQWATGVPDAFQQRRIYRYYKCPSCRQKLRVPKGKGKINITCPGCRSQFVKKT